MYLAPEFEAGLRTLGVFRESVLDHPDPLVGEPAEALRIGTSTPMPLSAEVTLAIANSDGTASSLVSTALSGSRDEIIRLVGSVRRFERVIRTLRDLDSWIAEEQSANPRLVARMASPPIGKIDAVREMPEDDID